MAITEKDRLALRESIMGFDPFLVEEENAEEGETEDKEEDKDEEASEEEAPAEEAAEEDEGEGEEEAPEEKKESIVLPVWKRKNFLHEEAKGADQMLREIKATTRLSKACANKKVLAEAQEAVEATEADSKISIPKGKFKVL